METDLENKNDIESSIGCCGDYDDNYTSHVTNLQPAPIRPETAALYKTRSRAMTFSPNQPENAPTVRAWDNLTVSTKVNGESKTLLNNISGTITGGFWAIMGASGGGKTTLLSTLALRLDKSKMDIEGDITLNGEPYDKDDLKSMSAYVMQVA